MQPPESADGNGGDWKGWPQGGLERARRGQGKKGR